MVKCQEAIELISAEIDGELETGKKPELYTHLEQCDNCRGDFELERATKFFIRKTIPHTHVPPILKRQILQKIQTPSAHLSPSKSIFGFIFNLSKGQLITAAAGSLAIIAIAASLLIVSFQSFQLAPVDNNILHQTYNNFHGLREGKVIPAIATGDPDQVKSYFSEGIQFPAYIPTMPDCRLMGAMFSEYTQEGTAHLVYQHHNDIIYIYEVALADLMDKDGLAIPDYVLDGVMKNDIYTENRVENCSMVMWIQDSILCCAIAQINNQQLISYLTSE